MVIEPSFNLNYPYDPDTDTRGLIVESESISPGKRILVHFLLKENLPEEIASLNPGESLAVHELPIRDRLKICFKTVFFNYREGILVLIGTGYLISINSVIIPLFLMLSSLKLTDTHLGIILVYTAFGIPLSVMISSQYIQGLPDSLIESAYIDGALTIGTFTHIIVPMCLPVTVTIGVISSLSIWNEFLLVLVPASSEATKSLPVGIYSFSTLTSTQLGWQLAALPALVVYLAFCSRFTQGVAAGAVKG